jgi:hypothetical protein
VTVLKGGSYMAVSCCHYHQFIEFGFSARAEDSARAENNFCTNEPSYSTTSIPRSSRSCLFHQAGPKLVMGHRIYSSKSRIYIIFC